MPIKVLDDRTVARIAAGEVIERPASVVKELVENALDAGSSQITVETRGGGVAFIRVIDDGAGIPSGEVELAFGRHATSKLAQIDDLESLDTLGFRGEALPSIAAVAEVEMVTSVANATGGDFVQLQNETVTSHTSQARPRGTTVTVKNLFRNVPARLKFLKSTATENSHIAQVVSQYALAFPEVRFTLLTDGRSSLQSPGTGKLLDSVIAIYGVETAQKMVPISTDEAAWQSDKRPDIKVAGMVSSPVVSRAGRDALSFFVNRRLISSRLLTFALEEAYQGLLMQGRHPIAVINITLPPVLVDVNVHPTKSEVKFQDERAVFSAVQRAVRGTLVNLAPIPKIEEVGHSYQGTRPIPTHPTRLWTLPTQEIGTMTTPPGVQSTPPLLPSVLPALRVVGQVGTNYIITEGPDGIYIIDQHAAHERILYEKLKGQQAGRNIELQGLLEPATLEVTPRQDAVLKECYLELREYGFTIEPFGERSYLVRTVPGVLSRGDWLTAVREFLDDPTGRDKERSEAIIKTLACHGAVRAGQTLTDEEIRSLIRQLEQTENPYNCPHGRPTLIHLSIRQLEREFGRG
ncbi:MAG: DNA mismatch repair endonuclease MutL [Dehalococcoidales bacterium]|nr:DNA mismatch repair endonuclease MutL [Dehalococcoidales bacterium]